jgi:hypothetical protein
MARWLIFGRSEYAQPLELEGSLQAESADEASARALEKKGRDWVELALLPEASAHWVLGSMAARGEPQREDTKS